MGFFDKFGAGGGKLRVELDQRSATAGGTIKGKVVFTGGKRVQKATSLSVALAQEDGGQHSVANITKKEIHGPFVSEAGQVQEFAFELGIPTVVMNSDHPSSTPVLVAASSEMVMVQTPLGSSPRNAESDSSGVSVVTGVALT